MGARPTPGGHRRAVGSLRGRRRRRCSPPSAWISRPRGPKHAAPVRPSDVRGDHRLRGRSEAPDRVPHRVSRGSRLLDQPGDRGADPVLRALRASCLPVLRRGARGIRGARADHRDLEDDEAGPGVRASLHGAGTPRPADRRPPERGDGSARRRRASAGRAPVHPDAGGPGGAVADLHLVLARATTSGTPRCAASSSPWHSA